MNTTSFVTVFEFIVYGGLILIAAATILQIVRETLE